MSVWTRVFGKTGTKPTEGPRGASKPPSKYDPRWDPPGSEHLEGSIVDSDIVLVSSLKVWISGRARGVLEGDPVKHAIIDGRAHLASNPTKVSRVPV